MKQLGKQIGKKKTLEKSRGQNHGFLSIHGFLFFLDVNPMFFPMHVLICYFLGFQWVPGIGKQKARWDCHAIPAAGVVNTFISWKHFD